MLLFTYIISSPPSAWLKTLESPLDCKEIQPIHSREYQFWVFFGRNDAKGETPVLWPPHAKSWLIGKYSDAVRDWGQEEKGTTEDEMAGWHHGLDGRKFEWTPGVGDGQGGLECCDSWGCKESDTTERLKWTELNWSQECLDLKGQWLVDETDKIHSHRQRIRFEKRREDWTGRTPATDLRTMLENIQRACCGDRVSVLFTHAQSYPDSKSFWEPLR